MLMNKSIAAALDIFLICIFILNIVTTSISNYTAVNFILKIIALILFACFTIISLRQRGKELYRIIKDNKFIKTAIYLSLFAVITGLTLFYSSNQAYGFLKWINLTFVTLPFVLITFINYVFYNKEKLKLLIITFGIAAVIMSFYIIIYLPFDYSAVPYKIDITRWSHVTVGRLLSLFVLVSLLCILFLPKSKLLLFNCLVFIISGTALYLTGLRAALLGFIIIIPIVVLIIFLTKKYLKSILTLAVSLILILILISILPIKNNNTPVRMRNIYKIENLNFGNDGAIKARLEGWKIGWEMYMVNPITGVGIGGYNQFYKTKLPLQIKYPHNLFIELIVEYGIMGIGMSVFILIIIFQLFFRILKSVFVDTNCKYNLMTADFCILTSAFLLLIFFLWLGMFSKDIATKNIMLLFFLDLKKISI